MGPGERLAHGCLPNEATASLRGGARRRSARSLTAIDKQKNTPARTILESGDGNDRSYKQPLLRPSEGLAQIDVLINQCRAVYVVASRMFAWKIGGRQFGNKLFRSNPRDPSRSYPKARAARKAAS